jgi:hypothetical protein
LIFASLDTPHPREKTVNIANAKKIIRTLFITLHLLSSLNPNLFIYEKGGLSTDSTGETDNKIPFPCQEKNNRFQLGR